MDTFMRVKSVQTGKGGGCTPIPFSLYLQATIMYKNVVKGRYRYASAERADTLPPISPLPCRVPMYCVVEHNKRAVFNTGTNIEALMHRKKLIVKSVNRRDFGPRHP
jgi:hypothetical protein